MKTTYKKSQPKLIINCNYKYFNNESFWEELLQIQADENNYERSFANFLSSCNVILNKHAPQKERKYVRENQLPFMNKKFMRRPLCEDLN